MEFQANLDNKAITISSVEVDAKRFVLKLKLLRFGPILPLETEDYTGLQQQLIFVDEEGTKIQTTVTADYPDIWRTVTDVSKVFYVINGIIKKPISGIKNVNSDKELWVTYSTRIRECDTAFTTEKFSRGFTILKNVDNMYKTQDYDIVGIFIEATEMRIVEGRETRIVTIIDEAYDRVRVVLLNEHAVHDAEYLDDAYSCKSVIAFCNVTVSNIDGEYRFVSNDITSIIMNPTFERAQFLLYWSCALNDRNVDLALLPSKKFINSRQMDLREMLKSKNDNPQNIYCKFEATIREVRQKQTLCYPMCKKCGTVLNIQGYIKYCKPCRAYQHDVTHRYFVEMILELNYSTQTEENHQFHTPNSTTQLLQNSTVTVKAYEGAKFLLGCNANEFMNSFKENGVTSEFYQRMIMAEGKKHSFMVLNYHKFPEQTRTTDFIIEEMHIIDSEEALGKY